MDKIHAEFDALLLRADTPGDQDWELLLSELDAHLRAHFEMEDQWMLETAFPRKRSINHALPH